MLEMINAAKVKIEKANQRLQTAQDEIAELEIALCDAQRRFDDVKNEVEKAEVEYKELLGQIVFKEKIENATSSFERKFYLAARICKKDCLHTHRLECVSVQSDGIITCDGCMAVIIKCDDTPKHLVGKLVPWDTLDLDEPAKVEGKYPDVGKIISKIKQEHMFKKEVTKASLGHIIGSGQVTKVHAHDVIVLDLDGTSVAINQKYLEYLLDFFTENEKIQLRWGNALTPILLEGKRTIVVIAPIRLPKEGV
jgi:hypothetical protein